MTFRPRDTPGQLAIDDQWLARGTETALEPELPIVDAHHHIWDPPGARYLFDEYLADLRTGHDIRASIFVECQSMHRANGPEPLRPVGETEFVAGVAAQSASGRYGPTRVCAAIVAHVDFALGVRFDPVVDAHIAASGGRLRGFRGRVSSHPDPAINKWQTRSGILLEESTRAAAEIIARRGLVLDIWAYQTQHDELAALCRAVPGLTVVLDHSAGPLMCEPYAAQTEQQFARWREGVSMLAGLPGTILKFGGFGMRFAGFDYHRRPAPPGSAELADDWHPYFQACLESFGADRMMFESNFPADKASYSFGTLWNAFKLLSADLGPEARRALFFDTANRVYRLGLRG